MVKIVESIQKGMIAFPTNSPNACRRVKWSGLAIGIIGALATALMCAPNIGPVIHSITMAIHLPPIYLAIGGGITFAVCRTCEKMKDKQTGHSEIFEPDTLERDFTNI